jgi:hypothetical protein
VCGQDEFRAPAGGAHGVGSEFQLAAVRAGEDEFAVADVHAMEFLRVVKAEEAGFHFVRGGVLAHHESEMASGALNATGSVQLGEEANEHAVSLTNPGAGTQGLLAGGLDR